MTTPQNTLYNIQSSINRLDALLRGGYPYEEEEEGRLDIYDMCKSIEIKVSEFNKRMESLEDKMNLIIKLLGKTDNEKT